MTKKGTQIMITCLKSYSKKTNSLENKSVIILRGLISSSKGSGAPVRASILELLSLSQKRKKMEPLKVRLWKNFAVSRADVSLHRSLVQKRHLRPLEVLKSGKRIQTQVQVEIWA